MHLTTMHRSRFRPARQLNWDYSGRNYRPGQP